MNVKQKAEISQEVSGGIYSELCKHYNAQSISVPLDLYIMIQAHIDLAIVRTSRICLEEECNNLRKQLERT